jgi:hypothetical protein
LGALASLPQRSCGEAGMAIERLAGQVIDKQIEVVNE